MKESAFKGIIAIAAAAMGAYFRALIFPLVVLTVVMTADYISGMTRAWIKGELSSRVGVIGIVKKLCYMFGVAVAIVADWVVQTAAAEMGLDLEAVYVFGLLVIIWLVLNECISILENISEIGVPIPAFLIAVVQKLKKTTEAKGDEVTK